ncbi:phosphatase PAP2 family protein [Hymenobacter lutimineralis]|uniref:Phosphatase PAP2 family protein n=1 Tax=Hymenobacter lutimineralis TaxID=2606448 RepID=A0A5D6V7W4_9BACT|nr:phosphatase PAP2 family protein [Hymenobacter lutimineralis]TYZ11973.1 phosphatase PAP2 family protein [Hymenobacter lutimineralis]
MPTIFRQQPAWLLFLWLTFQGAVLPVLGQVTPPAAPADTAHKYETQAPPAARPRWYQHKLVRATAIPAVLIGYGVSTINGNGLYSSYDARRDIQQAFPNFHTKVDDYLILAPYAELAIATLAGVESRNDRLNMALVVVKSELIFAAAVTALKYTTGIRRPDGSNRQSFPSGHTAQAFLAASIVHTEFRDKSQWYGVGAYTIATSVAALRMLNNRHWQSDVVAGAGLGILSAHLGYLTHRNRWGRKPNLGKSVGHVSASPWQWQDATGVRLVVQLR